MHPVNLISLAVLASVLNTFSATTNTKLDGASVTRYKNKGDVYYGKAKLEVKGAAESKKWVGIFGQEFPNLEYVVRMDWTETVLEANSRSVESKITINRLSSELKGTKNRRFTFFGISRDEFIAAAKLFYDIAVTGARLLDMEIKNSEQIEDLLERAQQLSVNPKPLEDGGYYLDTKAIEDIKRFTKNDTNLIELVGFAQRLSSVRGAEIHAKYNVANQAYDYIDIRKQNGGVTDDEKAFVEDMFSQSGTLSAAFILPPIKLDQTTSIEQTWRVDPRNFTFFLFPGLDVVKLEGDIEVAKTRRTQIEEPSEAKRLQENGERVNRFAADILELQMDRPVAGLGKGENAVAACNFTPTGSITIINDPNVRSAYITAIDLKLNFDALKRSGLDRWFKELTIKGAGKGQLTVRQTRAEK